MVALCSDVSFASIINNIFPNKKRRVKEFAKRNLKSLTNLINDSQLYAGKGAVNYGTESGLRNSAFKRK